MNFLITGATGLIGKQLMQQLVEQNHHINFVTTSKSKIISSNQAQGFYWNPKKNEIDTNCIKNVQIIIHLAGEKVAQRWTKKAKNEIASSRIRSTQLLYTLLKNSTNKVSHFIMASGTAIYPESFEKSYSETEMQKDNSFLSTVVQQWEEAAKPIENLNIKLTKIRTGVVFATQNSAFQKMVIPIKYGLATAFGTGKQLQSWIHITDLINIYQLAIDSKITGIINAVTPNPISNKNLTIEIAKKLKKPFFLPNTPEFLLKIIIGKMSCILLKSENIQPKKLQDIKFKYQFGTIQQALNDLLK